MRNQTANAGVFTQHWRSPACRAVCEMHHGWASLLSWPASLSSGCSQATQAAPRGCPSPIGRQSAPPWPCSLFTMCLLRTQDTVLRSWVKTAVSALLEQTLGSGEQIATGYSISLLWLYKPLRNCGIAKRASEWSRDERPAYKQEWGRRQDGRRAQKEKSAAEQGQQVIKVKMQQGPMWSPLYNSGHYFTNEETTLKGFMYRNRDETNDAQANGLQMVHTYIHAHIRS